MTMAKRKSLGRGLDALLSTKIKPNDQAMETGLKEIPVEFLQRGRYQPRLDMREESLEELANTIRSRGESPFRCIKLMRGNSQVS